jgi:hypothetical protein
MPGEDSETKWGPGQEPQDRKAACIDLLWALEPGFSLSGTQFIPVSHAKQNPSVTIWPGVIVSEASAQPLMALWCPHPGSPCPCEAGILARNPEPGPHVNSTCKEPG